MAHQLPALPNLGSFAVGDEEGAGAFIQALQKHDRRWSDVWVDWKRNRPLPASGRVALDPTRVPGEAKAFVQHFSLGRVFNEWDQRAQQSVADGRDRGIRRPRSEWDRDRRDERQTVRQRR